MNFNFIGLLSLNMAMMIYLVWFVPQIFLNFKRKNTEGLSFGMHGLLCLGYLSDLIYGFGLGMQWQYRLVSLTGLSSLAIQHYQLGRYGLHRKAEVYTYWALNFVLIIFLLFIYLFFKHLQSRAFNSRNFYDDIGVFSNLCWLTYMLPQIIKNFLNHSTEGLSFYFVLLAIFLNICDTTSAWSLNWDYPSKIGAPVAWIENSILLFQVFYYAKKSQRKI